MKQTFEIPEGRNRVTIEWHEDKLLTIFEIPIKESFMDKIVTINANCTGIEFKEDNPEWNAGKKQVEDIKPKRWRAKKNEQYYTLDEYFEVCESEENNDHIDEKRYKYGFYFQTEQQAESTAEKTKELLKQINP